MTTGDIPESKRYARYRRYNQSDKGKARERKRAAQRRDATLDHYLTRPFIAWDGEGINEPDGSHTYFLLANSLGQSMMRREGLSTVDCLTMLHDCANVDGIHVVYGGSYDVNMMLRDLPRDDVETLYHGEPVRFAQFMLKWRDGKSLQVSSGGKTVTLYDVSPFFQCSFVKACDEYLGDSWENREQIVAEKAQRGAFSWDRAEDVASYNAAELRNLVRLCDELRARLWNVGLRIKRWDGPGAIAASLLTQYQVREHIAPSPENIAECARYAYAGGRFECIRFGHVEAPAYQYDIRSAYPSAMRHLPCLAHGEWVEIEKPKTVEPHGMYRVSFWYDTDTYYYPEQSRPQPLFIRSKDSTISWPMSGRGWYWTPEVIAAQQFAAMHPRYRMNIIRGKVWRQACECQPFAFVEPLYMKRAALKKAGDGAHVGLKLGLNSLYGKLVQQVGWSDTARGLRIPPFHCLEWGGYITSHTRAELLRAAMLAPDDVIAFETDAIFTRVPLPLTLGERLGEWELTEYESLTYVRSGIYFGTRLDGHTEVSKGRGLDAGTFTREHAIRLLTDPQIESMPARNTRFIGAGLALMQGMHKWRRWITSDIDVHSPYHAWAKRIPAQTRDALSDKYGTDAWEETEPTSRSTNSYPYLVEWVDDPKTRAYVDVENARDHRGEDSLEWGQ